MLLLLLLMLLLLKPVFKIYICANYVFNSRCFITSASCTFRICLVSHSRQDERLEMQSTFSSKPIGMFCFSFMKTRLIHLISLTLLSVNDPDLLASGIPAFIKEAFRWEKLLMAMWGLEAFLWAAMWLWGYKRIVVTPYIPTNNAMHMQSLSTSSPVCVLVL